MRYLALAASVLLVAAASASGSTLTEFSLPNPSSKEPLAITAGPDGNVWFAEYDWGFIGKIAPDGTITEYDATTPGGGDFLQGITSGPDNNIWFTRWQANEIVRFNRSNSTFTRFPLDAAVGVPFGITQASDGNLWFAASDAIGKITPAGVITTFPLASGHDALGIVQAPNNGDIWFTDDAARAVGHIPLAAAGGTSPTEFALAGPTPPGAITTGPDGSGGRALWMVSASGKIARFPSSATSSANLTEFTFSGGPSSLVEGPDGDMYAVLKGANEIVRFSPASGAVIADYSPIPSSGSAPGGNIVVGPDSNLWFTNPAVDSIGRLTPGGPFGTAPPGISGIPKPGQTLTCSPATWAYSPTSITRQLARGLGPGSYTPIPGTAVSPPTNASYTVQSSDIGLQIVCEEAATNASGTGTIDSAPRTAAADVPVNTRRPVTTGTAVPGHALSCEDKGAWDNNPLAYDITWLRNGTPIPGETFLGYSLGSADVGARIGCAVRASNDVGAGATVKSDPLLVVDRPPVNTVRPVLVLETTGPRPTDRRATCNPGAWTGDYGDYAYQILRDGQPIVATRTYDVTVDDLGHPLSCSVVSHNPAGDSDRATSAETLVPLPGVDPAAGEAVIFSAGGLGPLDPVNLQAATNGLTSVLRDQEKARIQRALDTFLASCPAGRAHAAQERIPDPREIAKAQERRAALCQLLKATPPDRIQVGADGVRIIPAKDGTCVLGTDDPCAPLPIPITDFVNPVVDPLTREQNTPVRVLWDFNSDGRVDADCNGASPILHTLPDRGVYNVHAVIVLPDSQRLGQYPSTIVSFAYHPTAAQISAAGPKLIPAHLYYSNQGIYQLSPAGRRMARSRGMGTALPRQITGNQAQLGGLRSAQPMACKTQLEPPDDPDLPCVNDGYIGQMHVTGNLCPISERRIPAAEYDQLPGPLQNALHAKAIADFAHDGQQRKRRRATSFFPKTAFDAQALSLTQMAAPIPVKFQIPSGVTELAKTLNVAPEKAVFALDQIYTAKGAMKINGADVLPSLKAATLLIPSDADGWTDAVKSMDLVSSAADLQLDGIPLTPEAGQAVFKQLKDQATAEATDFANVQLDALKRKLDALNLGPFKLAGNLDVKLKDGVAIITAKADLGFLKVGPGGSPLRVDVTLRATPAGKISLQTVHLHTDAAYLGFMKLKNLDLTYDPDGAGLTIKGQILFPPLDAGVEIIEFRVDKNGKFQTFDAKLELGRGQGISIGPGIFITALHAGTHDSLKRIVGGATISAGPSATGAGCPAVGVEGTFTFDFPPPFTADVNADALIGCFKVGNAHLHADTTGYIEIDAHAHLDLGVIQVGGDIGGSLLLPNWQIEAAGDGSIADLLSGFVNAVISNRGIAACGSINIKPLGIHLGTVTGGMAVNFPGGVPPLNPVAALSQLEFFEGCDLGKWTPLPSLLARRQVGAPQVRSFTMPTSGRGAGIRIDGAGGAPRVKLIAPDGTAIDLSSAPNPIQGTGYLAVRSDRESRTIVLLGKPKGGTWQVQPVEGSPAITGLETSPILPKPAIKAIAGGVGSSRVLRYRIARQKGQVVRFVEQANGGARMIGTVKVGGRGTLRYRTAEAKGTSRKVIAQVQQDGLPRTSIVVARYHAPNPRVGRPVHVRSRRRGARATITWGAAAYAVRYEVAVRTGDGGRVLLVPKGKRRSVVVTRLSKREGFVAKIRGFSPAGHPGPSATARGKGSLLIGTKPRKHHRS